MWNKKVWFHLLLWYFAWGSEGNHQNLEMSGFQISNPVTCELYVQGTVDLYSLWIWEWHRMPWISKQLWRYRKVCLCDVVCFAYFEPLVQLEKQIKVVSEPYILKRIVTWIPCHFKLFCYSTHRLVMKYRLLIIGEGGSDTCVALWHFTILQITVFM